MGYDDYARLMELCADRGVDLAAAKNTLKAQQIETPSWGYANSGTRFKAFPWAGAAQTIEHKLDDAAMVHALTGIAPSVALHIPWDKPADGDYEAVREYAESRGIRLGAVNTNTFQDEIYMLGSFGHPQESVRSKAVEHALECCRIAEIWNSPALSLWFADGTNYAGQDSLVGRKRRFEESLQQVVAHLPVGVRLLLEYKFFEPAFYSTDVPDWGTSYAMCLKLGEKAQVLVDLGHHAQGVNIEQIVAFLLDEGKLGGFHFNNRKYADDDLIVGSVNPFELFLIYNELVDAEQNGTPLQQETARNVAYMIDQSHNIEGKVAPMIFSVLNCQEAYARALLVPRKKLAQYQAEGEVLRAHALLVETFRMDVTPLLHRVREELGVPVDPLAAYWASGYEERIREQRGIAETSGGFQ